MATAADLPVSARVMAAFAAFGLPVDQSVSYTILLQENRIVGHCYDCQGIRAVVLAGGNTVELYDRRQHPLRTVVLDGDSEVRKAA
jgi:hypothetical protein